MRRLWLSTAMLTAGAALMIAAQLAGATPDRRGGIFRIGMTGASVQIDPQVSYVTTGWWLEYATAAKLYNHTRKGLLVPEVASRFKVSNFGTRYTFFLRKGFRFSDGAPVTAASFKYAFDRIASPGLESPAAEFVRNVSRVRASGMKLVIYLRTRDDKFLATLALPFFQATSTMLPLDQEVFDVRSMADLPSAGPYVFTYNEANRLTSLRRNPYWMRGPGRTAPRNLAGVDVYWNLDEQAAFDMVNAGELDEGPVPASELQRVVARYGVNKTRFWLISGPCMGWIAFNNRSGLFQGNVAMRQAVNWALDRTDYIGGLPPIAATPWTHLLPPGFPGSITKARLQPYATRSNIAKARELAAGHFKDGKVVVYYRSSGTIAPAQAEIVRHNLVDLGFDPANITMRGFPGGQIYLAIGLRGADFDLAVSLGFCHEYANPGETFLPGGVYPPFFPDSPKYRNRIAAATRLHGNAQAKALGRLDLEIMSKLAPFAVMSTYNDRSFFSARVKPRSLKYQYVYSGWSIPALALK